MSCLQVYCYHRPNERHPPRNLIKWFWSFHMTIVHMRPSSTSPLSTKKIKIKIKSPRVRHEIFEKSSMYPFLHSLSCQSWFLALSPLSIFLSSPIHRHHQWPLQALSSQSLLSNSLTQDPNLASNPNNNWVSLTHKPLQFNTSNSPKQLMIKIISQQKEAPRASPPELSSSTRSLGPLQYLQN